MRSSRSLVTLPAVLAVLLLATAAHAARWRSYVEADGLPSRVVHAIAQGPDGAMWAATRSGLARLAPNEPGARWQTISTEEFQFLVVADDDRIWAGGGNGIRWFDADGSEIPSPEILRSPEAVAVTCLGRGVGGDVWAGYGVTVRRWHEDAGTLTFESWNVPVAAAMAQQIEVSPLGRVWIGHAGGFGTVEGAAIVTPNRLPGNSVGTDQDVLALLTLPDESILLGTASGKAYRYDPVANTFSADVFGGGASPTAITDAHLDAVGRLWLARQSEVVRFDTRGRLADPTAWVPTVFGAEQGLAGDQIRIAESLPFLGVALAPVGARALWFGTDQGVTVQSGLPWSNYRTEAGGLAGDQCFGANCDVVQVVALDPARETVWFGAGWGLSRLRNGNDWTGWANVLSGGPLTNPVIRALHVDADGGLWLANGSDTATNAGVQYHAPGAGDAEWVTLGSGADRWHVSAIARDEAGLLWLAAKDGAWRLDTRVDPLQETHFTFTDGLPYAPLDAMAVGDGSVFVASGEGIARYDLTAQTWTAWPLADLSDPVPAAVRDLLVLDHHVVAATDRGLLVVDTAAGSVTEGIRIGASSPIEGGLPDETLGVADGGDGSILVATPSGLYRVSASLDRTGRITVVDGLPEDEILCVASEGDEVWIGTNGDGAAAHLFEPPETALSEPPPAVLASSTSPVVIVAAGADPDSPPDLLRFELRIDEQAWQPPQAGPSLSFVPLAFGLDDGEHVVQVRAVDNGLLVDQSPAAASFELDTTPPAPRITAPAEGSAVRGTIEIVGTADDEDGRFDRYAVSARAENDPLADPIEIQPWTASAVSDGVLGTWDTRDVPDAQYLLEVIVRDQLGIQGTTRVDVLVDNQAPFAEDTSPRRVRGDQGATVYAVAGDASIALPPFAFDGEEVIRVDRESADPGSVATFRFGPESLPLRKKATVRILVPEEEAAVVDRLAIHRYDGSRWIALGGTLEGGGPPSPRSFSVSVATDRLGLFALRVLSQSPASTALLSALSTEPRHFEPRTSSVGRMSVSFVLGRASAVDARVYNRAGRLRRVLADGLALAAGEQVLYWDGRDDEGDIVPSALYILCVEAQGERVTQVVTVGRN